MCFLLQLTIYGRNWVAMATPKSKAPTSTNSPQKAWCLKRAYCQQPICMASRASLMSGLRPDTLDIYNCKSLQEDAPNILTLNQHFEQNGYQIWASGKIYHHQN
jgi:iduronate 2-sulfatase